MSFGNTILPLVTSAVSALGRSPAASLASPIAQLIGGDSSSMRDSGMADLGSIGNAVNSLSAFANGSSGGTGAATDAPAGLATLPAPLTVPQTKHPTPPPTDDHGSSNVVFTDSDASDPLIC